MHSVRFLSALACAVMVTNGWRVARGQQPADAPATPVREIFVPFEDLHILLEGQARRVFLTRDEYRELLARAKRVPVARAPREAAVLSADYAATLEQGRARLTGTLVVDVLEDGLHAIPLDFAAVGVRTATLDGQPASIGIDDQRRPVLFVAGKGRHELALEMVAPLETTAAQQALNVQLHTPAATQLRLTVPGNIDVKSGAAVVSRVVDEAADVTRLELLPKPGPLSLVMTLNNRLLRRQSVVVARSVIVDEVTEAYERLHATVSLGVLHGAVDRFRFAVPEGFEVTDVASPLLAEWVVEAAEPGGILEVRLREPASETVVLNVAAVRTPTRWEDWSLPRLEPLEVAGQVAVVGLLVEDRLKADSIAGEGLIPIDTMVLASALPESVSRAEPGAPRLRPVVAFYAPQRSFQLRARFEKPPGRLRVTTNLLLVLNDKGQEVRGGFALLGEAEKLFAIRFAVPPAWHVQEVTRADGTSLSFERSGAGEDGSRIEVKLPDGVPPGQELSIYFHATSSPAGWLGDWSQGRVEFPAFAVEGAARDTGAIAVQATDDLIVRPDNLEGLTPLDEKEKGEYGLEGVPTSLVYRYEAPAYRASLVVERMAPRISARTYSFLRLEPAVLTAHYEIAYDIQQARTRRLSLHLPAGTPAALAIRGLDGVVLAEYTSELADGQRRWSVLLAEARRGTVRLAVDFDQRLAGPQPGELALPVVRAGGVAFQSGIVAVEGSAELDVEVTSHPRQVDVGELVDAEYRPGRKLLGAFGFVGEPAEVQVRAVRHPGHGLPATVVERAELVTLVSTNGLSQTAARYQLRSKALFLEVQLPAGSQLWSAYLDGKPAAPQREGARLLLSLPAGGAGALRDMQIAYETPVKPVSLAALWGRVDLAAPKLFLRAERGGTGDLVPLADLTWHLHLPALYRLGRTDATVFTDEPRVRALPTSSVAKVLHEVGGRVNPFSFFAVQAAPKAVRRIAADTESLADDDFGMTDGSSQGVSGQPGGMPGGMTPRAPMFDGIEGMEMMREMDGVAEPAAGQGAEEQPARALEQMSAANLASGSPSAVPPVAEPAEGGAPAGALAPAEEEPPPKKGAYWALEGARSLKIDLEQSGQRVTFRSLGVDPRLGVTLVHRRRLGSAGWGVALVVGVLGLALTNRPPRRKARFVAAVLLSAALVPLVIPWNHELGEVFDLAFFAACLLVPYYLAAALVHWMLAKTGLLGAPGRAAAAAALAVLLAANGPAAWAQPPERELPDYLLPLLEPPKPVELPADALIVPYDPDEELGVESADKVLVPYDQYVALWNLAYPDRKIEAGKPPAPYALAGAAYSATLAGSEHLLVAGHLDIEIYDGGVVAVGLPLAGGVLARARIGGQPARLRVVGVDPAANPSGPPPEELREGPDAPAGSFVVLYASGPGRQRLDLEVRFRLERRGGWRIAAGRLPAAPATALTLLVPDPRTEVQLSGVFDRLIYETEAAGEAIQTALGPDGFIDLGWRPKVAEGQVDRSLTADSEAVLDVREDGLRLDWKLALGFPRSQRDTFTITVPAGYLVEKIAGDNVRGWEARPRAERQEVEVSLLKPARDAQTLLVHLARRGPAGQGDLAEFEAPVVMVEGAVLHQGTLTIRRSPVLELRTVDVSGAAQTDVPSAPADSPAGAHGAQESPLGVAPYQAYQFAATPFRVRLAASPLVAATSAEVRSLVKIAERQATLESRITLAVERRPAHHVRLYVPDDLEVEQVGAPEPFEWAVTRDNGRRLLAIYLAAGRQGEFSILVRGSLGGPRRAGAGTLRVPKLEVLDVDRQEGHIVVQVDPAFDVRALELVRCESVLLARVHGWLAVDQQRLARLALHYRSPDYAGVLGVSARPPRVNCYTLTNVRVTDRAIEETILLEFTIRDAGIRELAFLLPDTMKEARISAPLLRQRTVEPAAGGAESAVRVRLEFQDEVMDQLRVLVENDRLLAPETQVAPLPIVETGRTDQRYLALESAGRDEVVVDDQQGLDPVTREQREWRTLAGLLGDNISQAYVVREGAERPRLSFHTKDRAAVVTAGARIGLAQTVLVLDGNGAYRAVQEYRVDNTTEQFLEVELPAGADLWTARVAGEPVKPAEVPGAAAPGRVRIPLVKTAPGDRDYAVTLKYGGQLPALGNLRKIAFPLVRTLNINVELSQVRLRLPESHSWFNFGGTLRPQRDPGQLAAGYMAYKKGQVERLAKLIDDSSSFTQARAKSNLEDLRGEIDSFEFETRTYAANEQLQREYAASARALRQAGRQLEAEQRRAEQAVPQDNRGRLGELFAGQQTSRARNVVTRLGDNFTLDAQTRALPEDGQQAFRRDWFQQNRLAGERSADASTQGKRVAGALADAPAQPLAAAAGQPQAPQLAPGRAKQDLPRLADQKERSPGATAGDSRETARRYQQELQEAAERGDRVAAMAAGRTEGRGVDDEIRLSDGAARLTVAGAGQASELASLDVEFPNRGVEYLFTTPRGELEITARAIPATLAARLEQLALVALAALVVALVARRIGGRRIASPGHRRAGGVSGRW